MKKINSIIENFAKGNILVIGDVILDEYMMGDVNRISPEAPVMVLNMEKKEYCLGGAANVANNIKSLGGECTLIGQAGNDDIRNELVKELADKKIHHYLVERDDYKTIKKTRIMAQHQQVIRVDWEERKELDEEHVKKIMEYINKANNKKKFDLIAVSDYNKGMITPGLIQQIKKLNLRIIADAKPVNISLFENVFAIIPNLKEGMEITGKAEVKEIGNLLRKNFNTNVILKLGEKGASLFEKDTMQEYYLPTTAKEVFDVSGAGDTFNAVLGLCIANNANLYEGVMIANQAAGIVVGKLGTATLTVDELKKSFNLQDSKIKELAELKKIVNELKAKGKKIVFTNGCFDILHVGHLKLINKAKTFGDFLILGLNTDSSIRKIKGKGRPINSQDDRAEVLANIAGVDYIIMFNTLTPIPLIKELRPDVLVKGSDYKETEVEGWEIVKGYGGQVKLVEVIKGVSTTSILNRYKGEIKEKNIGETKGENNQTIKARKKNPG
jgi:D-beta-D-heptose 7-phosphate kinase/D-beta-D-heptose 1-phosphate adenosyltransferase